MFCASSAAGQDFFKELSLDLYVQQSVDLGQADLNSAGLLLGLAGTLSEGELTRLDLRLELLEGVFWGYDRGVEIALVPSLRLYFKKWAVHPYAEGGVGVSYHSLDIEELGTDFNFLSFAGLGLRIPLNAAASLELGCRLRHISNAGLDQHNHGVTAGQVQAGVSWAF